MTAESQAVGPATNKLGPVRVLQVHQGQLVSSLTALGLTLAAMLVAVVGSATGMTASASARRAIRGRSVTRPSDAVARTSTPRMSTGGRSGISQAGSHAQQANSCTASNALYATRYPVSTPEAVQLAAKARALTSTSSKFDTVTMISAGMMHLTHQAGLSAWMITLSLDCIALESRCMNCRWQNAAR